MNNGECADGINTFTCNCAHGFIGDTCNISEIQILDMMFFTISNLYVAILWIMIYRIDYTWDIDDCKDKPCDNGGTCKDGIGTYKCVCPTGFTGADCEKSLLKFISFYKNIDPDSSNLIDNLQFYSNYDFHSVLDIDDCQPNPCKNNGVCADGINSYTCDCTHGFIGDNCSISMLIVL